jgi:hypothetical protein
MKRNKSKQNNKLTKVVKLHLTIHSRLKIISAVEGIKMQELVNEALDEFLKQYE